MKKEKKYVILGISILGIFIFIMVGLSYARYASNSIWNYYLKSNGFYFNSDILLMNGSRNINNMWDGDKVSFSINNALNEQVVTEQDINYNVTCNIEGSDAIDNDCYICPSNSDNNCVKTYQGILSKYSSCVNDTGDNVNVSSLNQSSCEIAGYVWKSQKAEKPLYFKVINKNGQLVNDITVDVIATSTHPYKKTLNGKFILHRATSNTGKINLDYKTYKDNDRLVITNSYTANRCVHLKWNSSNLIIDVDTDKLVSYATDSNGYINEIRFNLVANNSDSFIFYKKDLNISYDSNSFTVEDDNEC